MTLIHNVADSIQLNCSDSSVKELNESEKMKLQELRQATEVFKTAVYYQHLEPNLLDVIKMTDGAIRRIIKFAKRLTSFKNLCVDDQIALLKVGTLS